MVNTLLVISYFLSHSLSYCVSPISHPRFLLIQPFLHVVIDFCLVKELMCEHDTNYQCLKLNWASKASLIQRRGHVTYCTTKHILSVLVTFCRSCWTCVLRTLLQAHHQKFLLQPFARLQHSRNASEKEVHFPELHSLFS